MVARRQEIRLFRSRVLRLHGMECFYCGKKTTMSFGRPQHDLTATVDHLLPVSEGGKHHCDNGRPACRKCNETRGDTPLLEYLASIGKCVDLRKNFDLAMTLYAVADLHGLIDAD